MNMASTMTLSYIETLRFILDNDYSINDCYYMIQHGSGRMSHNGTSYRLDNRAVETLYKTSFYLTSDNNTAFRSNAEIRAIVLPVQKAPKKQSVICSIAAKLAKHGIQNPMASAWQLHNAIIAMLHAIRAKNRALCKQIKLSVLAFLVKYDLVLNDLIPTHTATMFIFPELWLNN